MKKIASLIGALVLAVSVLGAVALPSQTNALGIDISKDQGNGGSAPAPSYNPAPANNGGQHKTEIYTKLESIYYRNGVVNFNYAFSNFGQYAATVKQVRYEGVLRLNQNYYNFSATGTLNNCYVAPGQTVRAVLAFNDARYGNYVGNLSSQGKTNTSWTTH